ncbi:MAG: cysteine desulfurase family protein [Litorivicinus sp.]
MIYLDYASTTPVDPQVAQVMSAALMLTGTFANPASVHALGWQAREAVEKARRQVAKAVGCEPRELVWTSGATESDNLAILGVLRTALQDGPAHLITSTIEHKAVLDAAKQAEAEGAQVTYLAPGPSGRVEPQQVVQALTEHTVLVSLMHLNNEVGAVNDLAAIRAVLPANVLLHTDAAQSKGKVAHLNVRDLQVDLASFSAHKTYGPKGIGALYVRRGLEAKMRPLQFGGGHERGLRSGTLPTHQIVGMGAAYALADELHLADHEHYALLRQKALAGITAMGGVLNGESGVPTLINVHFPGCDAEILMSSLPDVCVSSGSACNSADVSPSHVLIGMGVGRERALSSIRISWGRFSTLADMDAFLDQLGRSVSQLGQQK